MRPPRSEAYHVRRLSGLTQKQFWPRFGVTQSAGSRYESGKKMPESLCVLIALAREGFICWDPQGLVADRKSFKALKSQGGNNES